MSTAKQKSAARENLKKARAVRSARSNRSSAASDGENAGATERRGAESFAFPKEEKEPLNDAAHVRNAIARFNQVEDVTDAERDQAWRRITDAAKRFGVEVSESSWRELAGGGKSADG